MKYLLDSNAIIALVADSDPGVVERAGRCDAGDMVTSSIAYAEVLYGAVRGGAPGADRLRAFVAEVRILDFDQTAAQAYGRLPFKRASYDRLIAAHALAHDLIIVTHNQRDFEGIEGLAVENWFSALDPNF